eukprot:Gb_28404 [translate_table: standard]
MEASVPKSQHVEQKLPDWGSFETRKIRGMSFEIGKRREIVVGIDSDCVCTAFLINNQNCGDLVAGSVRRATGPRSGVRSRRASAHSLVSNAPNNNNGRQNDILHEFQEAGMHKYAEGNIPQVPFQWVAFVRLLQIELVFVLVLLRMSADEIEPHTRQGEGEYPSIVLNGMAGGHSRTFLCAPGQSISMDSGSLGSPSRGSDAVTGTPTPNNNMARLQHLEIQGDDLESPETVGTRKKKRGPRITGGEKGGRGLRQFSMKVCEKVESKGRTTYNEVADELVAEFANLDSTLVSPDRQQYDEKNIRRRVYDALNVLMAMDIIAKEKKEIQWKGLPSTSVNDIEQLKAEKVLVKSRIEKKESYLQELEEQRNERLYGSGNTPSGGVALPFILVQQLNTSGIFLCQCSTKIHIVLGLKMWLGGGTRELKGWVMKQGVVWSEIQMEITTRGVG